MQQKAAAATHAVAILQYCFSRCWDVGDADHDDDNDDDDDDDDVTRMTAFAVSDYMTTSARMTVTATTMIAAMATASRQEESNVITLRVERFGVSAELELGSGK